MCVTQTIKETYVGVMDLFFPRYSFFILHLFVEIASKQLESIHQLLWKRFANTYILNWKGNINVRFDCFTNYKFVPL